MFPLMPMMIQDELFKDLHHPDRHRIQPSRLEIHRRHLEQKKMHHLNVLSLDLHMHNDHDLVRRQQVAEAIGNRPTVGSRVRQSIGQILIQLGERVRPADIPAEPRFNA